MLKLSLTRRFWKIFSTTWLWKNIFDHYIHYITIIFYQLGNLEAFTQIRCTIIMPLMWDNVTDQVTGMALKEFFFSNFYISMNMIFECCYLFFGWEIGDPLSTYATGGMEWESSKMCTGAYRERGVEELVIRYVHTKWIASNKFCGIFFVHWFGQVH